MTFRVIVARAEGRQMIEFDALVRSDGSVVLGRRDSAAAELALVRTVDAVSADGVPLSRPWPLSNEEEGVVP